MPYVYILASHTYGTIYTGFTMDLANRVTQHRDGAVPGFTRDYRVYRLVWYEFHESILEARARERNIKKWHRAWKVRLIQEMNPAWRDLALEL